MTITYTAYVTSIPTLNLITTLRAYQSLGPTSNQRVLDRKIAILQELQNRAAA